MKEVIVTIVHNNVSDGYPGFYEETYTEVRKYTFNSSYALDRMLAAAHEECTAWQTLGSSS